MDDKTTINNKYKRSLGLLELVAFGLGGTIGSGTKIISASGAISTVAIVAIYIIFQIL